MNSATSSSRALLINYTSENTRTSSSLDSLQSSSPISSPPSYRHGENRKSSSKSSLSSVSQVSPTASSSSMDLSSLSSYKGRYATKPPHSYIHLISMAILNCKKKKILLGDIYQYIMDIFPYYNNKEKTWRNSIRHNLSLNECFVKNGRADNGMGNYWSIHPVCVDDFSKGDFQRRQARRKARKSVILEMNIPYIECYYNLEYVPMMPLALPELYQMYHQQSCSQVAVPPGLTYPNISGTSTVMYPTSLNN